MSMASICSSSFGDLLPWAGSVNQADDADEARIERQDEGGERMGLTTNQASATPILPWYVRPWIWRYSRMESLSEAVLLAVPSPRLESVSSSSIASGSCSNPFRANI